MTDRTKAVLFSTPHNPTGAVYSKEEPRGIAEISQRHNLVVITDEAYEYFVFERYFKK